MPIVEVHILEGYTSEDKSRLTAALTDAVRFVVPAADEAITVMLNEYPGDAYARGGQQRQPAPARPDPGALVVTYLKAMEDRDLDAASTMLHPDFQMIFPDTQPMTTLTELIDWAKGRYRYVRKTNDAVEALQTGGTTVVYVRGALAGEWPDGRPFQDIRFVDRFEVRDGMIVRQDVWNDIAEVRGS